MFPSDRPRRILDPSNSNEKTVLRGHSARHHSAPAKINLGLHVLRKRPDGYHDVETALLRIPWADVLHARPAEEFRFTCSDPSLPVDESNLVVRAAKLLADADRGAELHLEKHLPTGAGLGGGSSDAAAALQLLNELWDLGRSPSELAEIAIRIGSDVPFFLGPETAVGTGRGEELEPLIDPETGEPYRPPYVLVLAVPTVHVSTPEAYKLVKPNDDKRPDLPELILSNDLDRWRRELTNDFEGPVFQKYPAVREVKEALLRAGARYASLSGSGAAVYGFFEGENAATGAAEALRETGHEVWHGRL